MAEKILTRCTLGIPCTFVEDQPEGGEYSPETCQRFMDYMAGSHPDLVSDTFNCPLDTMYTHMELDPDKTARLERAILEEGEE